MENSRKLSRSLGNFISTSSIIRRSEDISFSFDIDIMRIEQNRIDASNSNYHKTLKKVYESGEVPFDIFGKLSLSNQKVSINWINIYNHRTIQHLDEIEKKLDSNLILQKNLQNTLGSDSQDILFEIEEQIEKLKKSNILSNLKNIIEEHKEKIKEVEDMFQRNDSYLKDPKSDFYSSRSDISHLDNMDFTNNNLYTNPLFSEALKGFRRLEEIGVFSENDSLDLAELKLYIAKIDKLNRDFFEECLTAKYELLEADKFIQFAKKNNRSLDENIREFDDLFPKRTESFRSRTNLKNIELADSYYSNILVFDDNSIIIIDKNGKFNNVLSRAEIDDIVYDVLKEDINKILKKNPFHARSILSIIDENKEAVKGFKAYVLYSFVESFKENLDIIKLYKFDIKELSMEAKSQNIEDYKLFEYLDDTINKIVKKHKVKQYAESISSQKYSHLYNDHTYKLCEELYDLDISRNQFQEYMGKKISAYRTPEQFNQGLKTLLDSFNSFTPESALQKAEHVGAEVFYEEENLVILKIETFEQSKLLGSSSWCISRDASYFDSYATDNEQYFIYDFSKESTDIASMIGLTISPDGEHVASHYKNDDEAEPRDIGEYIDLVNDLIHERSLENKKQKKLQI